MDKVDLLVVGAGPYGLAVAAHAQRQGLSVAVHGKPMDFWRRNMPKGMLLRSGADWHLDADDRLTFRAFLAERNLAPESVAPIPVALYIEYVDWFTAEAGLEVRTELVRELFATDGQLHAALESGNEIEAVSVVAAPGIRTFAVVPDWAKRLPADCYVHTCDLVDFDAVAGARCLIVGGRQSAFETAALLAEAGAAHVDVVYRHATPSFTAADWSFVDGFLAQALASPGWFRSLDAQARAGIEQRFWAEGRLKLEPWLPPRLSSAIVQSRPRTEVVECRPTGKGVEVVLSDRSQLQVDLLVLATGYRPDLSTLGFLSPVVGRIQTRDGFPVLDERMQCTVPGLFLTGFLAAGDFGPFLGFVRAAPVAAQIIVGGLLNRAAKV